MSLDLTLNFGAETQAKLNQAILFERYANPALTETGIVMPNMSGDAQVFDDYGFDQFGGQASTNTIADSNIKYTIKDRKIAFASVSDTFKFNTEDIGFGALANQSSNRVSSQKSQFNYIVRQLATYMNLWNARHLILGDKNADNISDGGYLNNSILPEHFNAMNGWLTQAKINAGLNLTPRIPHAKNGLATWALQQYNDTDTNNKLVTGYCKKLITADHNINSSLIGYNKQALNLKKNAVFIMDDLSFKQAIQELNSDSSRGYMADPALEGISALTIWGVPVINLEAITKDIRVAYKNDTGSNTVYYQPYFIGLTTLDNIAYCFTDPYKPNSGSSRIHFKDEDAINVIVTWITSMACFIKDPSKMAICF